MKRIALVALLVLTSCGGSSKVRDIVDFTPKLTQELTNYKVTLATPERSKDWVCGSGWINTQPRNFDSETDGVFVSHKISSSAMIAPPIIADGKVFILSADGTIAAFDSSSYKSLWSASLKTSSRQAGFSGGGMTYRDGTLYITHSTRDIIAYDAVDGRELWRRQVPDVTKAQPVLHKNVALVLTISNQLYAIDIRNGRILWEHNGLPETLSPNRNVAPIVHNDKVIVGYSSGQLIILNLADGAELWQMNFSKDDDDILPGLIPIGLESQPIIDGNNMYVATGNGLLLKIGLENGLVLWQKKVKDVQSMNKSGNILIAVTNAKQVAAFDDATGQVVWVTDFDPAIAAKKKSRQPTQFLTPLVINSEIVVISSDGQLYQLSPETGAITKERRIDKGAQFMTVGDSLSIFTKNNALSMK